ncbi:major facilitator superfamily domain-containing protein 12-like [Orussus abietinus]|uniref:major facilitator superfamily domain-containing protein 12-like n=1 Tax=Orussus abietinus TaxID=222816 RepID=UPI0006261535|nr:major facilitator superfamily domain-containing protein 12-like [Orussus abietinus]XP_023290187.1 major facilitator superfamily domain-containing protein 12-like [Orussus abietinus]
MDYNEEIIGLIRPKVPFSTKAAYALGHIFNDLAAAMWFSYTLLYLQRIALFQPITAGALLFLGQIVDALATPVFGFLVDRYYDKKKWHLIGSIMVTFSFPVIFGTFVDTRSPIAKVVYVASITVFQTGWPAVQISHLSVIPILSKSPLIRTELTAIRYSAQVGAAVTVFIITWIVLPANDESLLQVTEQDANKFRNIALMITVIGVVATIFFHIFLKSHLLEDPSKADLSEIRIENSVPQELPWSTITLLLKVAMLYVASRLFITLATIYLPLYIEDINVGGKQALATVPLVAHVSSFAAALFLKYITRSCGTRVCYLLGALVGVLSSFVVEFAGGNAIALYSAAILIGAGSSITMITSLSITADLIGLRTEKSALVYSCVTFLDKVVTGLAVVLIEKARCEDRELCLNYNRDTLATVCVSSMMLGLLSLMSVSRCLSCNYKI